MPVRRDKYHIHMHLQAELHLLQGIFPVIEGDRLGNRRIKRQTVVNHQTIQHTSKRININLVIVSLSLINQ